MTTNCPNCDRFEGTCYQCLHCPKLIKEKNNMAVNIHMISGHLDGDAYTQVEAQNTVRDNISGTSDRPVDIKVFEDGEVLLLDPMDGAEVILSSETLDQLIELRKAFLGG